MEVKKSVNMTFDELSMERSKNFVKALQELKNLRPQLYSAADYCEKSYLHNDQKQMVLDNLKEYAVRALVNAVDHLGTVASKLTEVVEQQASEIATMELKVSCVNQQLLCCHTFTCYEVLREHRFPVTPPKLHKHYILPNSAYKKVHFSPHVRTDSRQMQSAVSGSPVSKTLSWHLTADSKSSLKGSSQTLATNSGDQGENKLARRYEVPKSDQSFASPKRDNTPTRRRRAALANFFVKLKPNAVS